MTKKDLIAFLEKDIIPTLESTLTDLKGDTNAAQALETISDLLLELTLKS